MLKVLKTTLKIAGFTYAICFAFVAWHMPSTISVSSAGRALESVLNPLRAPRIVRTYAKFAWERTWPFGKGAKTIEPTNFIEMYGDSAFVDREKEVRLDLTPSVRPGKEGRAILDLSTSHYTMVFMGASADITGGSVLMLGRYFCLQEERHLLSLLFGRPRCYEILRGDPGALYLRRLGSPEPFQVELLDSRGKPRRGILPRGQTVE